MGNERWRALQRAGLFAVSLGVACGHEGASGASRLERVPEGTWGGDHVGLEVGAGGASAEYDCARGAITEPLELDADGRFDAKGTYAQERPGPVREGEEPDSQPARYSGQTDGRTMDLTVAVGEDGTRLGPFRLTHGQPARITKCL